MLKTKYILLVSAALALAVGCVREDPESLIPSGEPVDYEDWREPADLTVCVDLEKLRASFEEDGPVTRLDDANSWLKWESETKLEDTPGKENHPDLTRYTGADAKYFWDNNNLATKRSRHNSGHDCMDDDRIYSLAFFLVDMQLNADGSQPRRWGKIVAYRLFLTNQDGAGGEMPQQYYFHDPENISGYSGSMPDIPLHRTENGVTYTYEDDFIDFNQTSDEAELKRQRSGCNGFALLDASGELIPDDKANNSQWGTGSGFFKYDSLGTMKNSKAVIMTFKYDAPLHESTNNLEKLRRGDIWIMAVANFHMLPTTYKGQTTGWFVKEVIDYWHRNASKPTFWGIPANEIDDPGHKYELYSAGADGGAVLETVTDRFMGYRFMADAALRQNDSGIISNNSGGSEGYDNDYTNDRIGRVRNGTGASFLRHYKPLILASVSNHGALTPGENVFTERLVRLPARLTFTIANHSKLKLTVEHLGVSSNFAQAAAWLFPHDVQPEVSSPLGNYFTLWQDSIDVYSNKALVPFRQRIYPANMHTPDIMFDGLIYESGPQGTATPTPMTYNLTVEYKDAKVEHAEVQEKRGEIATDWTTVEEMKVKLAGGDWRVGESKFFLMQSARDVGYFVYRDPDKGASASGNLRGSTSINSITSAKNNINWNRNTNYIWELIKVDNQHVNIRNFRTKEYLKAPSGNNSPFILTTNADDNIASFLVDRWVNSTYGTVENVTGFYTSPYWMAMPNTEKDGVSYRIESDNTWNDTGSHYRLYEIDYTPYSAAWTEYKRKTLKNIPINVFDRNSGIAEPLTEIRRNDHIRVQIGVTYNVDKEDIEFQVRDWVENDNDLSFE